MWTAFFVTSDEHAALHPVRGDNRVAAGIDRYPHAVNLAVAVGIYTFYILQKKSTFNSKILLLML